ncbi:MAG: hypothetical protein PHR30_01335 [Gallionellaceae bacterium]|nr:hypothetical protein [Gallionellaceae bacterium]
MSADGSMRATLVGGTLILLLGLGGCAELQHRLFGPAICPPAAAMKAAGAEVPAVDVSESLLRYHQQLQDLPIQDLEWERVILAAEPLDPEGRVRLAMVLGQPRGSGNLDKAMTMLNAVLKSDRPAAVSLHPLARLLVSHYLEYQENAAAMDKFAQEIIRLNQQIKAEQLRAETLQQKIDALANIEHTLTVYPAAAGKRK